MLLSESVWKGVIWLLYQRQVSLPTCWLFALLAIMRFSLEILYTWSVCVYFLTIYGKNQECEFGFCFVLRSFKVGNPVHNIGCGISLR